MKPPVFTIFDFGDLQSIHWVVVYKDEKVFAQGPEYCNVINDIDSEMEGKCFRLKLINGDADDCDMSRYMETHEKWDDSIPLSLAMEMNIWDSEKKANFTESK